MRIRERLAAGETVLAFGLGRLMSTTLIQLVGFEGRFHALWFDHEHVGFGIRELEAACAAARAAGLDNFVRVAPEGYALVTRCLEAGSGGVMAAQIQSAAHAEQFVQWAKFAPRGKRGLNLSGFDARYGGLSAQEFCRVANRESFVAIQIETLGAVEQCEAIAAIDGVDLLFVGPADLSQALGVTGEFFHPKCLEAIDAVAEACRRHGKHWGAVTVSPEHARMLWEKGCRLISPANDVKCFRAGLAAIEQAHPFLFG